MQSLTVDEFREYLVSQRCANMQKILIDAIKHNGPIASLIIKDFHHLLKTNCFDTMNYAVLYKRADVVMFIIDSNNCADLDLFYLASRVYNYIVGTNSIPIEYIQKTIDAFDISNVRGVLYSNTNFKRLMKAADILSKKSGRFSRLTLINIHSECEAVFRCNLAIVLENIAEMELNYARTIMNQLRIYSINKTQYKALVILIGKFPCLYISLVNILRTTSHRDDLNQLICDVIAVCPRDVVVNTQYDIIQSANHYFALLDAGVSPDKLKYAVTAIVYEIKTIDQPVDMDMIAMHMYSTGHSIFDGDHIYLHTGFHSIKLIKIALDSPFDKCAVGYLQSSSCTKNIKGILMDRARLTPNEIAVLNDYMLQYGRIID